MSSNPKTLIYSIRMSRSLRQQLQRLAEAQDRKPAEVVRRMIKLAYADLTRQQCQSEIERIPDPQAALAEAGERVIYA